MLIGCPKEIKTQEYRVGLTPAAVRERVAHGHAVLVEAGAGVGIGVSGRRLCDGRGGDRGGGGRGLRAGGAGRQGEGAAGGGVGDAAGRARCSSPICTSRPIRSRRKGLLASGATAIAYETVTDARRRPAAARADARGGRAAGAAGRGQTLQTANGGRGVLLGGVPGVPPARVAVLGGGVVGTQAARVAAGMGAEVTVLDRACRGCARSTSCSAAACGRSIASQGAIEAEVAAADLVIGAVLVPGAAAPKLVTRAMLGRMRPGAAVVDVAIDQGGCFETSRPTTHADPIYAVDGVLHYCVANMPGAVARTATQALNNATLPFVLALADKGWRRACEEDPHLLAGLNVHAGHLTYAAVGRALGIDVLSQKLALKR